MRIYLSSDEHNAAENAFIARLSKWTSEDKVKTREQKYRKLTKCPKCGREISWDISVFPPDSDQSNMIHREINYRCDCNSYKYVDTINRNVDIEYVLNSTLKVLSKELKKINGGGLIYDGNVYK